MNTTKKVFTRVVTVIFIIALLIFSFATCSSNTSTGTDSATSVTDPAPGLKVIEFPIINPVFSEQFSKMSEEEKAEYSASLFSDYFNALEDHYPQEHLEIKGNYSYEYDLYYPVEFHEEVRTGYSGDFVIGVDEQGYLKVSWLSYVDFGSAMVHEESLKDYEKIIFSSPNCWVVYNPLLGEITKYDLTDGEESLGYVPKESVFVGTSTVWNRLIFQNGSDIWFVELNRRDTPYMVCSDVDYVIDVDYDLTDDANSEPLFMMEDGSVKAYLYYKDGGSLVDPRDYRTYLQAK